MRARMRQTLLDAWWTLLIYHGSLKGVGVSRNALQDIETFMARYQGEEVERRNQAGPDAAGQAGAAGADWRRRAELAERLAQLTSHMSADENARTFDRLRLPRGDTGGAWTWCSRPTWSPWGSTSPGSRR